jgi:hypothetical protein
MKLELMVGRTVAWARVIERALHEDGAWTFRTSEGTTPAHRVIDRERAEIVFTGIVRPSADGVVELHAAGDFVTMATADFSKGERLTWRLSLTEPVRAS